MNEKQKQAILNRFQIALHIRGLDIVLDYLDKPQASAADHIWREQAAMLAECPDLPEDLDVFYKEDPDWRLANLVV